MDLSQPFGGLIPGARGAVLGVLLRTGEPLTGRQIHRLAEGRYSLWSVQQALKDLAQLGVVDTRTVGRAGVHAVNNEHVVVAALRPIVSPMTALRSAAAEFADADVQAIILFGSAARGDATAASDIDLAVIAPAGWDRRSELQDVVAARLGNACDVVVFTPDDLIRGTKDEPVLADIVRDGVALVGRMPRVRGSAR